MKSKSSQVSPDGRFITKEIASALPLWIAAAVWIFAALVFPLYKLSVLILTLVLSVAAWFIARKLMPKETVTEEIPFTSGDAKADDAIKTLNEAMELLTADSRSLEDKDLETVMLLDETIRTLKKIRDEIVNDPPVTKKLRRFFDYYLPTELKISSKYVQILHTGKPGENTAATVKATSDALQRLNTAFKKQYDALFSDDSVDAEADLSVLDTMLKQDNLN